MNIFSKNLTGCFITDSEISLVEIKGSAESTELVSKLTIKLPENTIINGKILKADELAELVEKKLKKHDHEFSDEIVIVLPERLILSDVFAIPIASDELEKELFYQTKKRFPVNLDEHNIDFDDFSEDEKNVYVSVSVVKKEIQTQYQLLMEKVGFDIFAIEPENYALKRLLMKNNMCNEGIAVMSLHHEYGSCMIFENCGLWISKPLYFNIETASEIVSEELKVPIKKSKKLISKFGIGIADKKSNKKRILEQLIKNDIITTKESIAFAEDTYHVHTKKVVGCGESFEAPYVTEYAENSFAEIWENQNLHTGVHLDGKMIKKAQIGHAFLALAGALRSYDEEPKKQMNLF